MLAYIMDRISKPTGELVPYRVIDITIIPEWEMKEKQKPAVTLDSVKKWEPIKKLLGSLRLANVAAEVSFSEKGAHVQLTIPWAATPDSTSKE